MNNLNLWENQWRTEMITKARSERDQIANSYNALTNKATKYAQSMELVLMVREQVVNLWECSPAQLSGETSFNCATALPTGCGGIFKSYGDACILNGANRTTSGAIGQP